MKFDMSQAWNDATALLAGNSHVVTIIAGVFFFLPYLALTLLVPDAAQANAFQPGTEDTQAAIAAMNAIYAQYWWVFLLLAITQGIGMLALLSLLTDRSQPTVGEAIGFGGKALIPYLLTSLLQGLIIVLCVGVPLGIAIAVAGAIGGTLVGLIAIAAGVYLYVKFSLAAPVIGIEQVMNPLAVIKRSWTLTKGNSLRLFLFYFLLILSFGVVSIVIGLITGLLFGLAGEAIAQLGTGLVSALINAVFVCLFLAVLASVYRQLSGGSPEKISETFD